MRARATAGGEQRPLGDNGGGERRPAAAAADPLLTLPGMMMTMMAAAVAMITMTITGRRTTKEALTCDA